jgi:hypothetical protein
LLTLLDRTPKATCQPPIASRDFNALGQIPLEITKPALPGASRLLKLQIKAPTNGTSLIACYASSSLSSLLLTSHLLPLIVVITSLLISLLYFNFPIYHKNTASVPAASHAKLFSAYGILGKHILNLFPEMVAKKHKGSGKQLLHHCVFKARPAIAEDSVRHILNIDPLAARHADDGGALPLHWAVRNDELTLEVLEMLLRAYSDAPNVKDTKMGFLPLHWAVSQDHPNIEVGCGVLVIIRFYLYYLTFVCLSRIPFRVYSEFLLRPFLLSLLQCFRSFIAPALHSFYC